MVNRSVDQRPHAVLCYRYRGRISLARNIYFSGAGSLVNPCPCPLSSAPRPAFPIFGSRQACAARPGREISDSSTCVFLRWLCDRGVADKHMGTVPVEHLAATWTYMMSFKYCERTVQATIPLYAFPDETLSPSVTLLVNLFGQVCKCVPFAALSCFLDILRCFCCCWCSCCCCFVGVVDVLDVVGSGSGSVSRTAVTFVQVACDSVTSQTPGTWGGLLVQRRPCFSHARSSKSAGGGDAAAAVFIALSLCGWCTHLGNGLQNMMAIYNAVLTGRRVIFVGYNHAAGDVCKIVLAACALVSPPIQVGGVGRGRGRDILCLRTR